jgi:hypothetical protein
VKKLVWKPNRLGIGLDVGWLITDRDGVPCSVKWGNCKGHEQLPLLLADAQKHGHEVEEILELRGEWDIGDRRSGVGQPRREEP